MNNQTDRTMPPHLFSEPLFLSEECRQVFIPEHFARHLKPFQRDGIRFLYRQFSKKNSGAVLNDPSSYGKTVQVVLFLNALRTETRPLASLVLCSASDVQNWKYHFHLWTDSAKDVLDDSTNTFSKKEVFVNSIDNVEAMSRREWGIVVIDDDNSLAYLKQLRLLKTKFKIWLTNENLVNNLHTLSSIYEFINPNDKLDIKLFENAGLSAKQRAERDIALDIFCQDFVLRRTNECLPLGKEEKNYKLFNAWKSHKIINREMYFNITREISISKPVSKLDTELNTSIEKSAYRSTVPINQNNTGALRKNKDATGLKIKRSKEKDSVVCQDTVMKIKRSMETDSVVCQSMDEEPLQINDLKTKNAKHEQVVPNKKSRLNEPNTVGQAEDIIKIAEGRVSETLVNKDKPTFLFGELSLVCEKSAAIAVDNLQSIAERFDETTLDNKNSKEKTSLENSSLNVYPSELGSTELSNKSKQNQYALTDIQSSVKKVEELTNKQFKGSLLDSLF